jgi:hypothetical protein
VGRLKRMLSDRHIAGSRRPGARLRALKFVWRQVTNQMSVVYSAVTEGRSVSNGSRRFLAADYVISTPGFMTRLRRVGLMSPMLHYMSPHNVAH